jgi:hypothetical protein
MVQTIDRALVAADMASVECRRLHKETLTYRELVKQAQDLITNLEQHVIERNADSLARRHRLSSLRNNENIWEYWLPRPYSPAKTKTCNPTNKGNGTSDNSSTPSPYHTVEQQPDLSPVIEQALREKEDLIFRIKWLAGQINYLQARKRLDEIRKECATLREQESAMATKMLELSK